MTYKQYYDIAEKNYVDGNYQKALEFFKKAQTINETNDCLNYIGCCYLELENYIMAIRIFETLEKNSPEWERPIFNLGRAYLKLGEKDKAFEYFRRALVLNPNEEDSYYYLGVYYYSVDDYEKALEYYEKSLRLNNKQSETHLNAGMCYFRLNNYKKALEEFETAYMYDNDCFDAIYNKGIVLICMNRYQEALVNLLNVNNMKPNDVEIMLDIAHIYYKTKDFENANVWVNKILAIEPQHDLGNKLLKRLLQLKNNLKP